MKGHIPIAGEQGDDGIWRELTRRLAAATILMLMVALLLAPCALAAPHVNLLDSFEFGDPDGHPFNHNAFCRRSALEVLAASVVLDSGDLLKINVAESTCLKRGVKR